MTWVAAEIAEDRDKLTELMERVGASQNQVKQATAWVAEKASRLKLGDFGGVLGGDEDYGLFMALETLKLGVAGKLSLWDALAKVAAEHDGLDPVELAALADRASKQLDALERGRLDAASRALADD
jgi:O-acetylhomoserine/O-acetylserine sulfhydrylase-like pyridoxal-dependent enzyme